MRDILATLPRASTADRRRIIGASEVASILGLSPHRTAFGVWAARQEDAEPEGSISEVLERGRFLESGVIQWAAHRLGAERIEPGIPLDQPAIASPLACLAARPDSVLHYANREPELVEAKTSDVDGFSESDVPEWYTVQALMQLACVPGVQFVRVPAYLPMRRKLVVPIVERDAALIDAILARVADWHYRHLDPHGPMLTPPVDASADADDWIRRRWPTSLAPLRDASASEVALALQYAAAKASAKAADDHAAALGNQLRAAIADAEGLDLGERGKVTFKSQSGAKRVSVEKLRAEYPDAAAACTVQGESTRVLRINVKEI